MVVIGLCLLQLRARGAVPSYAHPFLHHCQYLQCFISSNWADFTLSNISAYWGELFVDLSQYLGGLFNTKEIMEGLRKAADDRVWGQRRLHSWVHQQLDG